MNFARAAKENPELRTALQKVVAFKANVHDEAGEKMADQYDAHHIPHFLLMDQEGKALDRWRGYAGPADWLLQYEAALADPSPVEAKLERFKTEPSEMLASALGRIYAAQSKRKDAVAYYRSAQSLARKPSSWYATQIVLNESSGIDDGDFTVPDVKAAADSLFGIEPPDDARRAAVGRTLAELAKKQKDPSILTPYLDASLRSAERDPDGKEIRTDLLVAQALLVDKDSAKAFSIKKDSLATGWDQDPAKLNDVAWWCFENEVSLAEAEKLARRGVELAKEDKQKAEILDTAAEISNKLGNRRESVALVTQAAKLDPGNEHYKEQILRFGEGLEKKQEI